MKKTTTGHTSDWQLITMFESSLDNGGANNRTWAYWDEIKPRLQKKCPFWNIVLLGISIGLIVGITTIEIIKPSQEVCKSILEQGEYAVIHKYDEPIMPPLYDNR